MPSRQQCASNLQVYNLIPDHLFIARNDEQRRQPAQVRHHGAHQRVRDEVVGRVHVHLPVDRELLARGRDDRHPLAPHAVRAHVHRERERARAAEVQRAPGRRRHGHGVVGRRGARGEPVRVGVLERKKRYTRRYSESLYVLTPAGFLHEYDTTDPGLIEDKTPIFSLFLPACTLGPPSDATSKSFKFNVEGRKDSNGTLAGSLHIKRSTYAWTFKARTRADMDAWWEDMRACAARSLEVEEVQDHAGPVVAAVRGAGYQSSESDEEMYVSADEAGAMSDGHETTSTKPPSYAEKGERVVGADAKALKDHQVRIPSSCNWKHS